jgi:anti-sigma factor RsiW
MSASNAHITDRELMSHLDGELTEPRRIVVTRHLDICDECNAKHAAMGSTIKAVCDEHRSLTDQSFTESARARLESRLAQMAAEPVRQWLPPAPAFAVAAVALIVASAAVYVQRSHSPASLTARQGLVLPVASITPGATSDVTVDQLCSGATDARPITVAMRAQVLSAYGVEDIPSDQYELDYLITPELGGATDIRNLWPQGYGSLIWNARVKDELEELLPRLVCSRQLDLTTAQRDMASDWIAAYKKYFKTDVPLAAHRGPAIATRKFIGWRPRPLRWRVGESVGRWDGDALVGESVCGGESSVTPAKPG